MEQGIDNHHIWFNRSNYRTKIEKRLRNSHGFVIPMDVLVHNELHATIEPPIKPGGVMIYELLLRAKNSPTPLDSLDSAISYLESCASNGDDIPHYDNAQRIADNLNRQREFIWSNQK